MLRAFAATLAACVLVAATASADVTRNPDGTYNCGHRHNVTAEVGKRSRCRLGLAAIAPVLRADPDPVESEVFRITVRDPETHRRLTLRCETVSAGAHGWEMFCDRRGISIHLSRYR